MKERVFIVRDQFMFRGGVHEWLLLSSTFSVLLLLVRMGFTSSAAYLFLPWNLFLAFIPYWITRWLVNHPMVMKHPLKRILVLSTWLLFIPNSFYIITDLFHLGHFRSAPEWFDLLLIFSFAWNGLLCGILSLRSIEIQLTRRYRKIMPGVWIFIVMWLSAFGIYIGRFLRFNSWDVIADPLSLTREIIDLIVHPIQHFHAWGMTFCYAVFMTLVYFTIRKMQEVFRN